MTRIAITIGYIAWFCILVRILFLSTDNPYTGTAEVLGSHAGLAFWLLLLSVIPFFIARHRAKKSGIGISWPYVMTGTTLIALVLALGGFYGQVHNKQGASTQSQDSSDRVVASSPPPTATRSSEATTPDLGNTVNTVPRSFTECNDIFIAQPSAVGNVELLNNYCQIATDTAAHPIKSSRALCVLQEWADTSKDPAAALQTCNTKFPLPPCPSGMEFGLENMRCEVKCDSLHGYAPDPTGRACYLACQNGGWPIYSGKVLGCN